MISLFRNKIRPIIISMVAPIVGFIFLFLLEIILSLEFSKQSSSIINLIIVSIVAFYVFPSKLGIPFGRIETRDFLKKVGFYLPEKSWIHFILGLILALLSLSGMLMASLITGRYVIDLSTVNFQHLLFSLNPALWEELFYRGVLMIWLLKINYPFKLAFLIQLVLFGLMHVKGSDFPALVDAFSVMVIAFSFTYAASKTRTLLASIVFHYFHDAFLFFVQIPNSEYTGVIENAMFYGSLWFMVGIGCIVTKVFVEKLGAYASEELYIVKKKCGSDPLSE